MSSTVCRTLIAVAGAIGLAFAASGCDARHRDTSHPVVPTANVIVVPSPDQVTGTIDASDMDWLSRVVGTASGPAER